MKYIKRTLAKPMAVFMVAILLASTISHDIFSNQILASDDYVANIDFENLADEMGEYEPYDADIMPNLPAVYPDSAGVYVSPQSYHFELEFGYREIPYATIELTNNRLEQVINLQTYFLSDPLAVPVWPGGDNIVESDYFRVSRGFSVGPGSAPYSPHYLIASGGGIVNIRVSPQADLDEGVYHDTLVITGSGDFRAEISLTFTVLGHPGISASTANINFGQIEEGFSHAPTVNLANSAGPLQINLRNNSIRTPIYTPEFIFDGGDDSPFIVHRGLYSGVSTVLSSGEPIGLLPSTNAFSANIRVAVREGTPIGTYTDTLRVQGAGQEASVNLSVTVVASTGFNLTVTPQSFIFPSRPQGYPAFTTSAILATAYNPTSNASRQINIQNNSAIHITNVTNERITFGMGDESPFEISSYLRLGTGTGTNAVTNALINEISPHSSANVRVRPVVGLVPGSYADTLYIRGDNGFELTVDVSFTVTERTEGFDVASRLANIPNTDDVHITGLIFPDRRVGYSAFTTTVSSSGVSDTYSHRGIMLTNLSRTSAVEGITASLAIGENFEITRDVRGSTSITAAVITNRMEPNNVAGTLSTASVNILVRPRVGLVVGHYSDTLQVRGLNGFAMDIPVSFTVYGDYGVVVTPDSFAFEARQVGYSFATSTGGWQEFLITNNSVENHTGLTVEFGAGLNNLFRIQRTFTRNNSTNAQGSTAAWTTLNSRTNSNSTNPHVLGLRIWPQNGLPIGVHTDTMTIRSDQGLEITVALSFEVLPPPLTWPEYITVQPGTSWTFVPRLYGYTIADNNTGWVEFVFRNNLSGSANNRTGITARLAGGGGSPFGFSRGLSTSAGAATSNINAGSTANIRIWPREGLAPGLHEDRLILEMNGEFYLEIPLAFRVYAPDFTVRVFGRESSQPLSNNASFTWHPRRYGIGRGSTLYPGSSENRTNALRPVEFIFTNNTGAIVTLPDTELTTGSFGAFNHGQAFVVHRSLAYNTMENNDVSSSRATTIVPGGTVGIRLIPRHFQLHNLPVGEHRDVFTLRDINGVELATIDVALDIEDWTGLYVTSPDAPSHSWLGQIAGTSEAQDAHVLQIPPQHMGYDASAIPATVINMNLDLAGGMDQGSGNISIYFYGGPEGLGWEGFQTGDSQFFTLASTSVSGITLAQAAAGPRQVATIRPREGLPPGVYTDTLVLRSRVINYFANNMDVQRFIVYVPVSFEVLPLDVAVYPPPEHMEEGADGYERLFYQFPSMRRGYSINPDEHSINLTFINYGSSNMSGITAEIISGGEFFSREIVGNTLSANGGQLRLRFWPHNMLGPGTYNGVIRLSDNVNFTMYIHMTFLVDIHDVSFPDPIVFSPIFVGYEPSEYRNAYIESFESDTSIYFVGVGENALRFDLGDTTPFRVVGPQDQGLQRPDGTISGTIGPEDIAHVNVAIREGTTSSPGLLKDELIIIGHDFLRRVPVSLAVHEVSAEITVPGIGMTSHKDVVEIPARRYGAADITPVEIRIKNTSTIPFTGLSGGTLASDSFQIVNTLQPRTIMPGQYGTITIVTRAGLPVGSHTDTLSFTGDIGLELDVEISTGMFEVDVFVRDYPGVRLLDPAWLTDHRYGPTSPDPRDVLTHIEGYTSVNTAPFEVSLSGYPALPGFNAEIVGSNFVIANSDSIPSSLTEDDDISILVTPVLGLSAGVYTAELVLSSTYGELERIVLVFEVLTRDWAYAIEGNGDFGERNVGYDVVPYNRMVLRNTGTGDVNNLTAYFRNADGEYIPARYSDNGTAFEMGMYVRNRLDYTQMVLGTLWGGMCACSTADMDVRPKTGLPVGTYSEDLIIKGINAEFNHHVEFVIPLTFTVTEEDYYNPVPPITPPPIIPPPTPPPTTPPLTPLPPITRPPVSTPQPDIYAPPPTLLLPDEIPPTDTPYLFDEEYDSIPRTRCLFGPFVMGFPDGSFRPDEPVTRAEFIQMLYNASIYKTTADFQQASFPDVYAGRWYTSAINYFANKGSIVGFEDGTFRPNNPITRAEITTLLIGEVDWIQEPFSEAIFSDVSPTHWAFDYIQISQQNGFVVGYPDGTFRPDAGATRSEAVVLINRIVRPCYNTEPVSYLDLRRYHWAYYDIIRASIVNHKASE